MTDEVKVVETDAKTALSDVQAEMAKLAADEKAGVGVVKSHIAWLIGVVAFVVGVFLGHAIR